jgi:hypothetical protein
MPQQDPREQWWDPPQGGAPRWEQPPAEHIGSPRPPGRRRVWATGATLAGAGLLAGAVLAGTLNAGAATGGTGGGLPLAVPAAVTSTTTSPATSTAPGGGGSGWWGWWHGSGSASVPSATAAQVQRAVLAKYPGATVWWVRSDSSGGYVAYTGTADGKALAVHLDGSYAVTGADSLPDPGGAGGWRHWGQPVPDAAAAHVKDAVLARYPGASVPWMWSDPDGGYVAYVVEADGTRAVLELDASYAITATRAVPGC